ncbi:hypothetical protein pneo_cds_913 [Pandoravirus neocaledonia]|uniref:Uncharacterized protein n=1 Tax=Pandoravirus neocaledonia TaxID=2107708 RepID=A0A2U7UDW4_9VIRU|nr:hypothetical protein pneo_cds_913 [Pandoravirus neocaledonia]AVK76520.1 hypothetical protein pneo_cds_913 [Pandoravirus neocaledonia]
MGMRRRCGPPSVMVGYSATEAVRHLERDPSLAVRVRWTLDADATQRLRALATAQKGARTVRSTFVDSFYGADDMPAAGRWLRCREVTSGPYVDDGGVGAAPTPADVEGAVGRAWCMRTARCVGNAGHNNRETPHDHGGGDDPRTGMKQAEDDMSTDDSATKVDEVNRPCPDSPTLRPGTERAQQRRRRRIYVHSDECDDTRLLRTVAPDSHAVDLSDLALGLYARIAVQRVVIKCSASMTQDSTDLPSTLLRIVIDTMDMKGGRGRTVVQGSAVVGDAQSASRLVALLRAAGVDPDAPPPPPKVAAYLAWRRPVLCARLIKRGAVDEASFDAS